MNQTFNSKYIIIIIDKVINILTNYIYCTIIT